MTKTEQAIQRVKDAVDAPKGCGIMTRSDARTLLAELDRLQPAERGVLVPSDQLRGMQEELERLRNLVAEQQATIDTLMVGAPDDGTTPVIRRIAALETENEALRGQRDRLADALRNLYLTAPINLECHSFHHARSDQHRHDQPCKPAAEYLAAIKCAADAMKENSNVAG